MRGLSRLGDSNTRVLVLADGHRANDNVEDIDHVEIIRGPSAAVYGSSAFSAVIASARSRGII